MFPIRFVRSFSTGKSREIIKYYYDFKSPYSYLSLEPALQLEKEYSVKLRLMPWAFRAQESFGGNLQERNRLNWDKVRYLYLDCRRFANERGLIIRGPERLFDSQLSLIAGLYADKHNTFAPFARRSFELFFKRELNLENIDEITKILYETSDKSQTLEQISQDFHNYANTQGKQDYLNIEKEAEQDHIFGVPTFILRGEPFFGNDRLPWVKKKLDSLNLHQ